MLTTGGQVNESLYDTSRIISSMTSCMVARVGPHSDVAGLTDASSVPVINALSNDFHPLQTIADFLTIHEAFPQAAGSSELVRPGLKIAWVGDSNNVLFDLANASMKLGVQVSVASPQGYSIPKDMEKFIRSQAEGVDKPGQLEQFTEPAEAIKDADILVTDTWVSMGQEEESKKRMQAFEGFQITDALLQQAGWAESRHSGTLLTYRAPNGSPQHLKRFPPRPCRPTVLGTWCSSRPHSS